MKKILFVNLKRFGDIFSMEQVIQSFKADSPHYEIGVVVYKEFEAAANCIAGVTKVYTIDRKRISMLCKKQIFSKDKALNEIVSQVKDIETDGWSTIFNYSNDKISTMLTSYLSADRNKEFIGIRYKNGENVEYSNDWSLIFNEVIPAFPYTPKHFLDIYTNMASIQRGKTREPLLRSTKNDKIAKTNFDYLRNNEAEQNRSKKIIGIQLTSSEKKKSIPKEVLTQFITLVENSENFKSVLLIAPTEDERNYATEINNEFNETLVIVEADFKALVSVVSEIDYLVTPDTAIKHIADLLQKKTVEVNLGNVSFRKQGTVNEGNIVLRPAIYDGRKSHAFTGKDIYQALEYLDNKESLQFKTFSKDLKVYITASSVSGTHYIPHSGPFDANEELSAHTLDVYLTRHWLQNPVEINKEIVSKIEGPQVIEWCKREKEQVGIFSKCLLKTLRSLIQAKENQSKTTTFIDALDQLFEFSSSRYLIGPLATIIRAKLESSLYGSEKENENKVEKHLYELKGMIQQMNELVIEIDAFARKSDILRKSSYKQRPLTF